jgi:hypothetical protein
MEPESPSPNPQVPATCPQNVVDFIRCVQTFRNIYVVNPLSVFYFSIKISASWVMAEAI